MTRLCVAIPEDIVHRRSHETTRVRWNIIKVCRHSIHCFESIIGIWHALISRKKIFWVGTMKMITAVDAAAEDASDPETKSRLKQAAGVLGGVARDVVTKTLAEVVARQVGA